MIKAGFAACGAALLLWSSGAPAQVIEGSRAFTFSENNNSLAQLQLKGGDPGSAGDVKIEFFGHMAFRITSPEGVTALFDPWRNEPTGFWGKWFFGEFPEIPVDVAVSTHAHFDHDALYRPHALMTLERPVGVFSFADVRIIGLADKHQCASAEHHKWDQEAAAAGFSTCPPNNPLGFDNTIQVVQTGGLKIVVWGDNRPTPNPALDAQLKNADVLILPIDDSGTLLTRAELEQVIHRYNPRAIIPAHYAVKGLSTDVSGFQSADGWVASQKDVRRVAGGELVLNAQALHGATHRVYYFGDGFKRK